MVLQDLKVGDKFQMDGLSVSGKTTKVKCELIQYGGMNKYVVSCQGITILVDGDSKVYNVIKEIEIMTNLISENKSQIMEFATAECENGNQNKQNIIDQLKDSFIEFKIGWVTKAVDIYISNL